MIAPVYYIDSGHGPMRTKVVELTGRSVAELAEELGVPITVKRERMPWTQAELDRGDFEAAVVELQREHSGGGLPAPTHAPDDPCSYCDALRYLIAVAEADR